MTTTDFDRPETAPDTGAVDANFARQAIAPLRSHRSDPDLLRADEAQPDDIRRRP